MPELQTEILVLLENHRRLDTLAIAQALGAHPLTVLRTCENLRTDGHVRVVQGSTYELTPTGRQHLEVDS